MIKVTGHINPDTDSICAAIAYSWYLSAAEGLEAEAFAQGKGNREAEYVLDRFRFEHPSELNIKEGDTVAIVDTNNPDELPEKISEVSIYSIIDHHKLFGGIKTSAPIAVDIRPVACTTTIIWEKVKGTRLEDQIPAEVAGLMLAAIISDTLKFTSATTTELDKAAAKRLAEIAEVEVEELAEKMFAAKSDLTGLDPADLVLSDSKLIEMNGKKVRVSVLETTDPQSPLKIKEELQAAMRKQLETDGVAHGFFFVVDILNSNATGFVANEADLQKLESAFDKQAEAGLVSLVGVTSRKKQMVPALERVI